MRIESAIEISDDTQPYYYFKPLAVQHLPLYNFKLIIGLERLELQSITKTFEW